MRAFPVLGVAVIAILIGGGLYYLQDRAAAPSPVGTPETAPTPKPENVSFRTLETGGNAAKVTAPKNYAAYSQAGLIRLWGLAHGTDGTVPPPVDFAKEYVIGVFAGTKPTGGYDIRVTSVTDQGSTRTIAITLTKPGTGCITTQSMTSPYDIIAVPVSDTTLAHTDTETATSCK